jgi:hypothetical protein
VWYNAKKAKLSTDKYDGIAADDMPEFISGSVFSVYHKFKGERRWYTITWNGNGAESSQWSLEPREPWCQNLSNHKFGECDDDKFTTVLPGNVLVHVDGEFRHDEKKHKVAFFTLKTPEGSDNTRFTLPLDSANVFWKSSQRTDNTADVAAGEILQHGTAEFAGGKIPHHESAGVVADESVFDKHRRQGHMEGPALGRLL